MQDKKIWPELFMEPETKHQSGMAMNNSTIKKTEIENTTASEHNWDSRIGGKHIPLGNCGSFRKQRIAELDHRGWARFQIRQTK